MPAQSQSPAAEPPTQTAHEILVQPVPTLSLVGTQAPAPVESLVSLLVGLLLGLLALVVVLLGFVLLGRRNTNDRSSELRQDPDQQRAEDHSNPGLGWELVRRAVGLSSLEDRLSRLEWLSRGQRDQVSIDTRTT